MVLVLFPIGCIMRARCFFAVLIFTVSVGAFGITLDAMKINTAGVYAAGSSVPVALRTATAVGKLASKWPVVIGMSILHGVLSDLAGNNVQWLPGQSTGNLPVPAGWNGANEPPVSADRQKTYSMISGSPPVTRASGIDPQMVCDVGTKSYNPTYYGVWDTAVGVCREYRADGGSLGAVGLSVTYACASGYKLVGSSCSKDEGATYGYVKWPSDGIGTIQNNGSGTWNNHVRETDTTTGTGQSTIERDDTAATDEYGNPTRERMTAQPDGGVKYERWTQGEDSVGAPTTVKHTLETNNTGTVTNNTYQYFSNQTVENVYTSGGTPTSAQPVDINFPDDYSREQTLQSTNTKLDEIKEALAGDGEVDVPDLETVPDFEESWQGMIAKFRAGPLGGLLDLGFEDGGGECPVYEIPVGAPLYTSVTLDVHCTVMEVVRPTITLVMTTMWAFVGLWIIFSA